MRVLMWNIERFTLAKVDGAASESPEDQERAEACRSFILETVTEANPDVFVVLEPLAPMGELFKLVETGNGAQGLVFLLKELRTLDKNWCLVPPLRVNPRVLDGKTYTETVGVYWRDSQVNFVGPYVWPQGPDGKPSPTGPPIAPNTGKPADSYPLPWNEAMPGGSNANWAAQIRITPGDVPNPPIGGKTRRQPYITDFYDKPAKRTIRLISLHLPPNAEEARTALARIADLPLAEGDPDVLVIGGDMNINLVRPTVAQEDTLDGLGRGNFNKKYKFTFRRLTPYPRTSAAQAQGVTDAFSMLKRVGIAALDNYSNKSLLDYGLAYYRAGVLPPDLEYRAVVADRVVGVSPLQDGPLPIKVFSSSMRDKPGQDKAKAEANFRAPENYGRIRDTSDHMAVLMEV